MMVSAVEGQDSDALARAADANTVAELASVLRALRRRHARRRGDRQLSYREVARLTGWSTTAVSEYLTGTTLPSTNRFDALIRLFGATVAEQGVLATARDRVDENRRDPQPRPDPPDTDGAGPANPNGPGELVARFTLPADVAPFTGRDEEVEAITTAVLDAVAAGRAMAVHAIDGMPGIGKTALAVHVAHRLADRFPDGQLFIDLHAHTPGQEPMSPTAALAALLVADGVDARYLPDTLYGRALLWRHRLATRKVLLVLDNAGASDQVRPLLPGHGQCAVLITSRRHLGDLPATAESMALPVLSAEHARSMFVGLVPRAAGDPLGQVDELMRLVGHLPLALSLLAKVYRKHPAWRLADLLAEANAGQLTVMAEHDTVATAFDLSYRHLTADRQRFFRRISAHPGVEIDPAAAAALAGIGAEEATHDLDALHGDNLLIETGHRRYAMHDLIRQYASALADADAIQVRHAARQRLLCHYTTMATVAERRLAGLTRPVADDADDRVDAMARAALERARAELPDFVRALRWARDERANLQACLSVADDDRWIVDLAAGLAQPMRWDGMWADAVAAHTAAVAAAARLDDRLGMANALCDLGCVHHLTDDFARAARAFEEALAIYVDLGHRLGQANALTCLGNARRGTGDYPAATQALARALGLFRELGDRRGQATALLYQGGVLNLTSAYPSAAAAIQEALMHYRAVGDRLGQAAALNRLAAVRGTTGDYARAIADLQAALDLSRGIGDRIGQVTALSFLGRTWCRAGDGARAMPVLLAALDLARDSGDRLGQANVRYFLGIARRLTGDHAPARDALTEALRGYRELGDRGGTAEALNELGTLLRTTGDHVGAHRHHADALHLARELRSAWDEAHALAGLGRCAALAGDHETARAHSAAAQAIFVRIGAAESAQQCGLGDHTGEPI